MIRRIALIAFFSLSLKAFAHTPKEGDIWATAGPLLHRTVGLLPEAEEHQSSVGGGIVVEADLDYNGGVEIAMLYEDKIYSRSSEGSRLAEKIKRMYVTTGYRHWFMPELSSALSLFSSYSMGDPKIVFEDRPAGQSLLETTAREVSEYGMDLSVQWEFFDFLDFALVADARYSWSLSKKSGEDADLYGILLGFKYLVPKQNSGKSR